MRRLFTFFLLFFAAAASAQEAPEADTFLYRISKPGRPVSYLLGTVHVGRIGAALPAGYRRTLGRVSQLVVEADEEGMNEAEQRKILLLTADSRPLKTSLGVARIKRLQAVLDQGQEQVAIDPESKIKPWAFWMSAQTLLSPKGYSYRYGTDNLLIQAAKKQHKTVLPLEGVGQLAYFARLPEDAVIRSLDSIAAQHKAFLDEVVSLEEDYRRHRAKKMWAEISDPDHQLRFAPKQDRKIWHEFLYGTLLTERNQKWLPRLIEILPQKPTLVAVGSAHLFGGQGLVVRLRQVGYRVEPVMPRSR